MSLIGIVGRPGFFTGRVFVPAAMSGTPTFAHVRGVLPPFKDPYVLDDQKKFIILPTNGRFTVTDPACGWTYSINGGVDTVPVAVTTDDIPPQLKFELPADILCSDTITISYDNATAYDSGFTNGFS